MSVFRIQTIMFNRKKLDLIENSLGGMVFLRFIVISVTTFALFDRFWYDNCDLITNFCHILNWWFIAGIN